MWPFERKPPEQAQQVEAREPLPPLPPRKIRPCWCGSVRFDRSERFLDVRWCMECGTLFNTGARDSCGS